MRGVTEAFHAAAPAAAAAGTIAAVAIQEVNMTAVKSYEGQATDVEPVH
jgi:hypothetical protein